MLAKMKKQTFDSLDHAALGWACIEPTIIAYKNAMRDSVIGDDFKVQFYKQLNSGQQALFAFQIYYVHAIKSMAEFYWRSAYNLAQPTIWKEIKGAFQYFGDHAMLKLLEEMEELLHARNNPSSMENFDVAATDLDHDAELLASITPLNALFHQIAPTTLECISDYIRNNPDEFVEIDA